MLPQIVSEDLVHQFKYWHNGIQDGMRYGSSFYAHVRSYPLEERSQAYELGGELARQQIPTYLTRSDWRYAVWINLQASALVGAAQSPSAVSPSIVSPSVVSPSTVSPPSSDWPQTSAPHRKLAERRN